MQPTLVPTFFPWFESARHALLADRSRLAHAWLLHGQSGMGQVEFAMAAAQAMLCEAATDSTQFCGQCQACHWFTARNHPDLRIVRPQALEEDITADDEIETAASGDDKKASQEIKIEQIRALEKWINVSTHRNGLRVVVLYPAQALNTAAANALLKTLEEPSSKTVFLLVSDQPARLVPTIRSRCRLLPLPAASAAQATQWLAAQGVSDAAAALAAVGGAPLAAAQTVPEQHAAREVILQMLQTKITPLNAGEMLSKFETALWLDQLQRISADLIRCHAGVTPHYFPAQAALFKKVVQGANANDLFVWQKDLCERKALVRHPLNPRLFAESAMLECLQWMEQRAT